MLTKLFARYLSKEDGATAIEYGLIAAGIAVAISAAVFALGDEITSLFEDDIVGALQEAGEEASE